ncbi:ATP-dependent DNA/RNA helicase [Dirofilaria immitis]
MHYNSNVTIPCYLRIYRKDRNDLITRRLPVSAFCKKKTTSMGLYSNCENAYVFFVFYFGKRTFLRATGVEEVASSEDVVFRGTAGLNFFRDFSSLQKNKADSPHTDLWKNYSIKILEI